MAELDVVTSLFKVAVVLGLLGMALVVLRRIRGTGGAARIGARKGKASPAIQVVERQMIGRATLAVVRFRGQEALLGISDDKITVVARPERVDNQVIDLRESTPDTPRSPDRAAEAAALLGEESSGLVTRLRELTVRH